MKRRTAAALVLFAAVLLTGCKAHTPVPSRIPSGDITIVVWDAKEPHLPGASPYSELASLVTESYAENLGITVELDFKTRQEIEDLLLGNYQGEIPSVVFSTEWPFVGVGTQDLTELVRIDDYLEAAASFWVHDGKLMGIPSYVHWLCAAKRAGSGNSLGETGYLSASPGFLHSALDFRNLGWTAEGICTYVEWVRESYGLCSQPVLDLWEQGGINMMYPVTPHLFKWIRLSETGPDTLMMPMDSPDGVPSFYFTVPGYVIMDCDEQTIEHAVGLAQLLAVNRGRWAARAIGCIPAYMSDIPLFDLESGFTQEERVRLMGGFLDSGACIDDWLEYDKKKQVRLAVTQAIEEYLSGSRDREQFEQSIHHALKSHTNQ
ncbi:MAG TPA: hypothetical protein GXZ88_08300 [Firmicutes bacterium]|jgi:hypothetical protein|nr:hypothetical protein [Candidatus Fermentithermobacillaceae bacterium]